MSHWDPAEHAAPDLLVIRISGRPGPKDRPPLSAGHPTTWALITDGTVLDGSPYPYPVFTW